MIDKNRKISSYFIAIPFLFFLSLGVAAFTFSQMDSFQHGLYSPHSSHQQKVLEAKYLSSWSVFKSAISNHKQHHIFIYAKTSDETVFKEKKSKARESVKVRAIERTDFLKLAKTRNPINIVYRPSSSIGFLGQKTSKIQSKGHIEKDIKRESVTKDYSTNEENEEALLKERIPHILSGKYSSLIAEDGNKNIIGSLDFTTPYKDLPGTLFFKNMIVAESWRRQGIATSLLNYLDMYAKTNLVKRDQLNSTGSPSISIYLEVLMSNTSAIALYEKQGFKALKKNIFDLGAMFGIGKILMKKDIKF